MAQRAYNRNANEPTNVNDNLGFRARAVPRTAACRAGRVTAPPEPWRGSRPGSRGGGIVPPSEEGEGTAGGQ